VTSVRRSSQSDPNNAAMPMTPAIVNTAHPLNIRPKRRGCFAGEMFIADFMYGKYLAS